MPVNPPTESYIRCPDGTRLFVRDWPVREPKASLAIVHGYHEHSGRYEHLADAVNRSGVHVVAFDLRGHGRSAGKRGHIHRFSQYLDDLGFFLSTPDRPADQPLFLLGHSLGGLIVCNYALHRRPEVRGIVISSPFLGPALRIPPVKILLARICSVVHPSFSLSTGLPPAWLSRDPSVGRAYQADPLVFSTATARWFTEVLNGIEDTKRNAGRFTLPCLVLQAGDDRIADPKAAKPLFEKFASIDKTYVEYPGLYHEILNEIEKDKVIDEMRAWIADRTG